MTQCDARTHTRMYARAYTRQLDFFSYAPTNYLKASPRLY